MYQKIVVNGYIAAVSCGVSQGNITKEEYLAVCDIIHGKPKAEKGFEYRLKENLTWEVYKLPETDEKDEVKTQ